MPTERPTKRRKLQGDDVAQFIDFEAQVLDSESEGDEEEDDLDDLIDDEEPPTVRDSDSIHRHILREALIPISDNEFWEGFLQHVNSGGRRQESNQGDSKPESAGDFVSNLAVDDKGNEVENPLWSVIVKPGYEESTVFRVFRRLTDARFPANFEVRAVFGQSAQPGRVFFEASSRDNVTRLCRGLPNVFPSKISAVSVPDPRTLFHLPDSFQPKAHGWVRLRHGIYKGDVAFVTHISPCLLINVRVVPRLVYEKPQKRGDDKDPLDEEEDKCFAASYNPNSELLQRASALGCPSQALFNPTIAKRRFRRAFQVQNNYVLYKGVLYDQDGYAILQDLDTDWYTPEDSIPMFEEFARFSACSEIPLEVRTAMMAKMAAHVFHVEDAVKVVEGDGKGLFGRIIEIKGNEADLFLPSRGLTSTLPLSSLRKNIRVGDAVRVTSRDHQGFTGWVVNQNDDDVSIFDDRTRNEVGVSLGVVESFSPAFHYNAAAPDCNLPLTAAQKNAMKGDSNSHLVGKHVTVTQGNFKTYRGRIKSTMGDGRVLVELEAQLQCPEPFNISSLHLNMDAGLLPAMPRNLMTNFPDPLPLAPVASSSSGHLPLPNTALNISTRSLVPYPHMLHPFPPPEVPATPLPSLQDIPESPAWNPSSRTPRPGDDAPPPYWLKDSCFNGMRLSLRLINTYPDFLGRTYEGKCGEFKGVVGDAVKIKDGFKTLEVPFKYLIPERPEMARQTVTAFDGPHKGHQFKIQRFTQDVCGCSELKARSYRRQIDAEIQMKDVVVTWG